MARASSLVGPKLSAVLITIFCHYKLDEDGGIQFMLGCDLDLHCNISHSDDIFRRVNKSFPRHNKLFGRLTKSFRRHNKSRERVIKQN